MYSVIYNWNNVIQVLNNPLNVIPVSNELSINIVLFHIYHCICYWEDIKLDEKIHHILMVFILNPILWLNYVNICDFAMFFMTGLPGGITYLMLFLKNMNIIKSITEKHISMHLNLWIRAPGCIITAYIIYLNYINNTIITNNFMCRCGIYLGIFGSIWNGMYFTKSIITSYVLTNKIN